MEHFEFLSEKRWLKQTYKFDSLLQFNSIQTFTIFLSHRVHCSCTDKDMSLTSAHKQREVKLIQHPYKPFHCDSFYGLGLGKKMSTHKKSKTSNKQRYTRGYLGYIVFLVNKHTCTYINSQSDSGSV